MAVLQSHEQFNERYVWVYKNLFGSVSSVEQTIRRPLHLGNKHTPALSDIKVQPLHLTLGLCVSGGLSHTEISLEDQGAVFSNQLQLLTTAVESWGWFQSNTETKRETTISGLFTEATTTGQLNFHENKKEKKIANKPKPELKNLRLILKVSH